MTELRCSAPHGALGTPGWVLLGSDPLVTAKQRAVSEDGVELLCGVEAAA